MPGTRKPAKQHRPRLPRLDAHLHAVDRVATLLPSQQTELSAPMQAALDAFRQGRGDRNRWCDLADACNVGEALALAHIGGQPLLPIFAAAQAALAAVHGRQQQRGSWTLRGEEIHAIDEACYWHRWQLGQASQGELHDAIEAVKRRVSAALAGSVAPGTTVCRGGLGGGQQPELVLLSGEANPLHLSESDRRFRVEWPLEVGPANHQGNRTREGGAP